MTVLSALHVIHSLEPGGAERVLVELGQVAAQAGLQVTVVSVMRIRDSRIADELAAAGIRVLTLDVGTRWDPRAVWRGLRVARQVAPDVIHTHLKHADLVGAAAARRLGIPMVSTLHVIEDAPRGVARAKRRLAARARLRYAALTITVSEAQRRWYLQEFPADPGRVTTIHNGVAGIAQLAPHARQSLRISLGVPAAAVMVTLVGLLRPGKGHAQLLAALRLLPDQSPITAVIVGDGSLRGELATGARALPQGRVVFTGFRTDVAELLSASDIVVQPSLFDALPTALIQALAAGRPTVASDTGGIPEIVTPDVGVLVPPGDVGALAQALQRLAEDPAARDRLGAEARRRFEQCFAARHWAAALREAYLRVLARPAS